MKPTTINTPLRFAVTLLLCYLATLATAQENLEHAFDKFITSKNVTVSKSFSEERDITKDNRPLLSRADVYTFTLKAKHKKLIDEVLTAFEKDRNNENVYLVLNHTGGRGIPTNGRQLLVGNDTKNAVYIGMDEMENWQLLCMLDPTDDTRSHRYAYAIEWNEHPAQSVGGVIRGKLVVTYSVVPKNVHNYTASVKYNGTTDSDNKGVNQELKAMIQAGIGEMTDINQLLAAFETLKTEFLKGNATNNRTGVTIAMTIYLYCSQMGKLMKGYPQLDNPDLRQHLISELQTMINRCDKDSDLGRSHIGYLKLAQKALK